MIDEFHMLLGYKVVVPISHRGTSPRVGVFFNDPYIIRLVCCLGIRQGTGRMCVVWGVALTP